MFGRTSVALATVLALFMGGLALGGWIFGRWVGGRGGLREGVALYGRVELGVALFGALSAAELPAVHLLFTRLFPFLESYFVLTEAVRIVLSGVVMLPATLFMGGTFPAVGMAARRVPRLAHYYALNTVGGALAALAGGFLLIPALGYRRSFALALALSAVAGGSALLLARRLPGQGGEGTPPPPARTGGGGIVATALFLAGFVSLGLELAWTRLLSVFLLNTTYTFTVLLCVDLLATALGGWLAAPLVRRLGPRGGVYGVLLALSGVLSLAILPWIVEVPLWLWGLRLHPEVPGGSWGASLAGDLIAGGIALFLPALLFGVALPVGVALLDRARGGGLGGASGRAYAWSGAGGALGALAAALVLLPGLGVRNTVVVLAWVSVAAGVALFLQGVARGPAAERWMGGLGVPLALGLVVLGVWRLPSRVMTHWGAIPLSPTPTESFAFYAEGANATVTVEPLGGHLVLRVNGIDVAGLDPESLVVTQKLQGHLPLLLHPSPRKVLAVGFGSGGTSRAVRLHGIEVDAVEIEPAVVRAAPLFSEVNQGVYLDPGFHLWIDDIREWLPGSHRTYDVILTESIHPALAGNGSLYTREYFDLCRAHLRPSGIVSVWVPIYRIARGDLRVIARTFAEVFPFVTLWRSSRVEHHMLFIGSEAPFAFDAKTLSSRLSQRPPEVASDLKGLGFRYGRDLAALLVKTDPEVRIWADGAPLNTDDRPILEFSVPRRMSDTRPLSFE